MRFKISFAKNEDFKKIKNDHIQKWLYDCLSEVDPGIAKWLHNEGIKISSGRVIKPIVYSRLYRCGIKKQDGKIVDFDRVGLKVSTPDPRIVFALTKAFVAREIPLSGNGVTLQIEDVGTQEFRDTKQFFTLSPILLKNRHGYVSLSEYRSVLDAVNANLAGKYEAVYGQPYDGEGITYFDFKGLNLMRLKYGDYTYQGIEGPFVIRGDHKLIRIAYDMGIGAKNACGFGCIEATNLKDLSGEGQSDLITD
jgi:CRISPR-associated endoribonuclease Cas6